MTVLETIQRGAEFFIRKGIGSPRLEMELLLAHVLGLPRLKLYLSFDRVLVDSELERLRELVKRRGTREPLQHILGSVCFCGIELAVSPAALIPRPETEILAERAWQLAQQRAAAGQSVRVLDLGTGSGCLAIATALRCGTAEVHAADASVEALALAAGNANRHGVGSRVRFHQTDGFAGLPTELQFDFWLCNPPYIPSGEIAKLEPEVRDFDPRAALDGGPDGLDFYRRWAGDAGPFMAPGAQALLEFGDGQASAVRGIMESQGWRVREILRDYTGRERFCRAQCEG